MMHILCACLAYYKEYYSCSVFVPHITRGHFNSGLSIKAIYKEGTSILWADEE